VTARHPRGDCGQVTVLVALLVVPLLGISGLVIDVGYAYFTQRTLRAQADAAALAGAQRLPDAGATVVQAKAVRQPSGGEELPGASRHRDRDGRDQMPALGAGL